MAIRSPQYALRATVASDVDHRQPPRQASPATPPEEGNCECANIENSPSEKGEYLEGGGGIVFIREQWMPQYPTVCRNRRMRAPEYPRRSPRNLRHSLH